MSSTPKPKPEDGYCRSDLEGVVCRRCETPLEWDVFDDDPDFGPIHSAFCCGLHYDYYDGDIEIKHADSLRPYTPPDENVERPSFDPLGQITDGDECKITDLEHAVCNHCNRTLKWELVGGSSPSEPPLFSAICCNRKYEWTVKTVVASISTVQPDESCDTPPPES